MIEKANILHECEEILSNCISKVSLLGQIELTLADIEKLSRMIREELQWTTFEEGLQEITENWQTCLATLLVWDGILGYRAGDYWSTVSSSLCQLTANQRTKIGQFFLKFLKRNLLPSFYIEGAHRYVTPILAHGGIPDYCLSDFFENVLWPIASGELEIVSKEADEIIEEWQSCSSLFYFTDKPITRFLQYGGNQATSFLSRCMEMAERTIAENEVPTTYELDLPPRIIQHFEDWLEKNREKRTVRRKPLTKFRRPIVYLDPAVGEIRLTIPTQRIEARPGEIIVVIMLGNKSPIRIPIKVYAKGNAYETEEIQRVIEDPAEQYEIRLTRNGSTIRQWTLNGIKKKTPFLCFSEGSQELIGGRISFSRFWLVYPEDYNLIPDRCIIESGAEFYGNWEDYHCTLIDALDVRQLTIKKKNEDPIDIPLAEDIFEPKITGGNILEIGHSERAPIFIGSPPQIQIPVSYITEFQRLQIIITPIGNTSIQDKLSFQVDELIDSYRSNEMVNLALCDERLLGNNPIGSFRIHLRGRLGQDKRFTICCIPTLKVQFHSEMYYPTSNGSKSAIVSLTTMPNSRITISEPARISPNNFEHKGTVTIPPSERHIQCKIEVPVSESKTCSIPLTIQIPRVRWSLRGLTKNGEFLDLYESKEISIQEWENAQELQLLVSIPNTVYETATVNLRGSEQILESRLRNGKARFPLHAFSTSLKNTARAINEFFLKLGTKEPIEIAVLDVRSTWEIDQLILDQKKTSKKRFLSLNWNDKGQVNNRILRLRNLWCPWMNDIAKPIPNTETAVVIEKQLSDFLPGLYELEFTIDDPWGHRESPPENRFFRIRIGENERIPLEKMGSEYSIRIFSILDYHGKSHVLKRLNYTVRVHSYEKNEYDEEIYMGTILIKSHFGELKEIPNANPIRFTYDSSKNIINSIEDRDGDGFYYCSICDKIFWYNGEDNSLEEKKGHKQFLLTEGEFLLAIETVC